MVLLITLLNVSTVKAYQTGDRDMIYSVVDDGVNQVIWDVFVNSNEKDTPKKCTKKGVPELWYYLDGDTPSDTAYSDYLEDLQWWKDSTPNHCKVKAEKMP